MTKFTQDRPITRETAARDRRDPIVVELHPLYVRVWVKGRHHGYIVPWDMVLDLGRKIEARQRARFQLANVKG